MTNTMHSASNILLIFRGVLSFISGILLKYNTMGYKGHTFK